MLAKLLEQARAKKAGGAASAALGTAPAVSAAAKPKLKWNAAGTDFAVGDDVEWHKYTGENPTESWEGWAKKTTGNQMLGETDSFSKLDAGKQYGDFGNAYSALKAGGEWDLSKSDSKAWKYLEGQSGGGTSSEQGIYNALVRSGGVNTLGGAKGIKDSATEMLTSGGVDAARAGEIANKGFADSKSLQYTKNKSKHGGVAGALDMGVDIAKATAPIWMSALGGMYATGTGAFGGTAAAGGSASAGGTAAATKGVAGTALYSTPAKMAGEATLFGGVTAASTPALTTYAGASGSALFGTTVPTATVGAGAAGGMISTDAAIKSTKAAVTKPAAASKGLFGTSITTSDALTGLSAASSLIAPKMPSMPGVEPLPERGAEVPRVGKQFETRAQDMSRRATAAGALRSENDADLLGSRPGIKKRGAARRALYGI